MCGGIGQWIDDLQLLDDRAGPPVRDDERQRIVMFRADVNEVNAQPIDLGHVLRQRVQPRLALAPIVIFGPIARELLHRRELHTLRIILDRFPLRPLRRVDAPAEVDELLFRNIDVEGPHCVAFNRNGKVLRQEAGGTRGCRGGQNVSPRGRCC